MTRINRAYVKWLEDLIVQLDSTLSDVDTAQAKGYLARDMPLLRKEAEPPMWKPEHRSTAERLGLRYPSDLIADIGPNPTDIRLSLRQDLDLRIVAMEPVAAGRYSPAASHGTEPAAA